MNLEFQRTHDQINIQLIDKETNSVSVLSEKDSYIIDAILRIIIRDYSQAYEALERIYGDKAHYRFLMVRRFIKCNMSIGDAVTDFDGNSFNFEQVVCPLRGECNVDGVVCRPKFNTDLSERELEVAKLIAADLPDHVIADKIFISVHTVINHKKNIYKKLDINKRSQLISYIHKNYPEANSI